VAQLWETGKLNSIPRAVEVTAQVGEHGYLEVLVLEVQGAPALGAPAIGEVLAQGVGVVELARLEDVERRVRVGRTFFIRGQVEMPLPGADGQGSLGVRGAAGEEHERGSKRAQAWGDRPGSHVTSRGQNRRCGGILVGRGRKTQELNSKHKLTKV
jgi:hypothetical protein